MATEWGFVIGGKSFFQLLTQQEHLFSIGVLGINTKFWLVATTNEVALVGLSSNACYRVRLPVASVDGVGNCCFDLPMLKGICKAKEVLRFTCRDSKLEFSALKTNYHGELQTLGTSQDLTEEMARFIDPKDLCKISTRAIGLLKTAITSLQLKNIFQKLDLVVYVQIADGKLVAFCGDNWHMGFFECDLGEEDHNLPTMSFAISNELFASLSKILTGSNYSIAVSDKYLKLFGSDQIIAIPMLTFDTARLSVVQSLVTKPPAHQFEFEVTAEFFSALTNTVSLVTDKNTSVELRADDSGLFLSLRTSSGQISSGIATKYSYREPASVLLNPEMFEDLTKFIRGETTNCVVGEKDYRMVVKNKVFRLVLVGALAI